MSHQTIAIPPALGLQPPSGADVVLLSELTEALLVAEINVAVTLEPIAWTPPSGRAVMYRQDAIDALFKAGIPVDAGEVLSATSNDTQPIDDAELEALLDMREDMGGTDSFYKALDGALDGILSRLYAAERNAKH
ncbi:hypothetical protein MNY66_16415 (plasmid) [Moellerella wisconsensis]|uniref:Uncharacterized protein n=1 Tax=Moellerella wisconsensis TaxID=158849 RepID=A0ACD3YD28_9GAMM|nr:MULTISPECIES: hypothetical protein [Morganellaceae]UNH40626.1 hypothetical protein MNY70_17465 [Moellerella wisconsensis]UNH44330.1 hypothetical protein MNY66_16415 [Moellerella wisconsensis]